METAAKGTSAMHIPSTNALTISTFRQPDVMIPLDGVAAPEHA